MKEISFKWKDHFWYTYEHCKNDTANCKNAYLGTNVDRTSKGTLKFPITYNPKTFENDQLNTIRTYECAFIESCNSFSYGRFEFKAIIGNSPNTWPAIWLYGLECWPPEIDIVEAFPNSLGNIIDGCKVRYETNIHYNEYNPTQYGAKGIWKLWYKLTHKSGKPDTWVLNWTPKYVKIYFNGLRIRKITNKKVLATLNRFNKMRIVINNMLQENFNKIDYVNQRNFELVDFKYKPYGK